MYKGSSEFLCHLRLMIGVITPIWAAASLSTAPAPMARQPGEDGRWRLPHPSAARLRSSALPVIRGQDKCCLMVSGHFTRRCPPLPPLVMPVQKCQTEAVENQHWTS